MWKRRKDAAAAVCLEGRLKDLFVPIEGTVFIGSSGEDEISEEALL